MNLAEIGSQTTIVLARHGLPFIQTDVQGRLITYTIDVPLVDQGKAQIKLLAEKLQARGITVSRVYSSPALRTLESAKKFAEQFGIDGVITERDLRDVEVPGAGPFTFRELEQAGGEVYSREILDALDQRAATTIANIVARERGKTIAIFSHGDFIRVYRERLGQPVGPLPPMREMSKSNYLKPAEAWVIIFNSDGKPTDVSFVSQFSDIPQGRTYP